VRSTPHAAAQPKRKPLDFEEAPAIMAESIRVLETFVPALFDDIEIGLVVNLGTTRVEFEALETFIAAFTPGWTPDRGAPDAMVFSIWARLDAMASTDWPQTKRLGVDALRWVRNPPAGEQLRGRMTVMAKDPVGDTKGIVIAQHDLLDEEGRLVFSCLTRSIFTRKPDGSSLNFL